MHFMQIMKQNSSSSAASMTKIYSQLSADNADSAVNDMDALNIKRLKQMRGRTMSECAGMHYADINFAGSDNNPILQGKGEMEKTYYTGTIQIEYDRQVIWCLLSRSCSCTGWLDLCAQLHHASMLSMH